METKKNIGLLPFGIITVILGVAVFKQMDFENLKFKEPALGTIYLLTLIMSVFLIVKGKKQNKGQS